MAKDRATLHMQSCVVADAKRKKRNTLAEYKLLLGIGSKPTIPYHRYEKVLYQTDDDSVTVERRPVTVYF